MLNAADGDDRLKHTAERWMRDLEGWSCAVELLWWSQLIRPTDGWLVPWAQRRRNLTGERLTRRCLWQYKCVGLYNIYTIHTMCRWVLSVYVCVCVHKYANLLLLYTQPKPQSRASLHVSAHTAPSVLPPDLNCLAYKFQTRCRKRRCICKGQICDLLLWLCVFFVCLFSFYPRPRLSERQRDNEASVWKGLTDAPGTKPKSAVTQTYK